MISHLICIAIISTIIIEINSSPILSDNDLFKSENDRDFGSVDQSISSGIDSVSNQAFDSTKPTPKTEINTSRKIKRSTSMFIDNSSKTLETAIKLTTENFLRTMGSLRDALKGNVNAAQKLGELAFNTMAQVPTVGVQVIKNFSENPGKPDETNRQLK